MSCCGRPASRATWKRTTDLACVLPAALDQRGWAGAAAVLPDAGNARGHPRKYRQCKSLATAPGSSSHNRVTFIAQFRLNSTPPGPLIHAIRVAHRPASVRHGRETERSRFQREGDDHGPHRAVPSSRHCDGAVQAFAHSRRAPRLWPPCTPLCRPDRAPAGASGARCAGNDTRTLTIRRAMQSTPRYIQPAQRSIRVARTPLCSGTQNEQRHIENGGWRCRQPPLRRAASGLHRPCGFGP